MSWNPMRTLLALAATAALLAPQLLACCSGSEHACTCGHAHGAAHHCPMTGEGADHCEKDGAARSCGFSRGAEDTTAPIAVADLRALAGPLSALRLDPPSGPGDAVPLPPACSLETPPHPPDPRPPRLGRLV